MWLTSSKISIFGFILTAGLVGCDSYEANEHSINNQVEPKAVESIVVISGGFASCPVEGLLDKTVRSGLTEDMYDLFMNTYEIPALFKLKTGATPMVLNSCYTGPTSLKNSLTTNISGRFGWNTRVLADGAFGVTSFNVDQGAQLTNDSFLEPLQNELRRMIGVNAKNGMETKIYFIGHSYGGYTAMNLARNFKDNLWGLVTIDPISVLDCKASDMVRRPDKTLMQSHSGCLRAPKDYSSIYSTKRITQKISESNDQIFWSNFYQTAFGFLHSSSIEGDGIRNVALRDFKAFPINTDHHSQSASHDSVWFHFKAKLRESLSRDGKQ